MKRITKKTWLVFAATTCLLFGSFSFNALGALDTLSFVQNFKDSESLVSDQLACKGSLFDDQLIEIKPSVDRNKAEPVSCVVQNFKPYSSQFGLQGKVYTVGFLVLHKFAGISPAKYVAAAQLSTALLSSIVFSFFVLWVYKKYGASTAAVVAILISISPMVVGFGRNLYWALPLLVLPIIYSLYLYDQKASGLKQILFWVGLSVILYIRYLCGYEYITSITIMVAAVLSYHLYVNHSKRKKYALVYAAVLSASVIAFGAALGTHIFALKHSAGSYSSAAKVVKERALARTTGSAEYLSYPSTGLKSNLNDFYSISNTYLNLDGRTNTKSELWATFVSFLNYSFIPIVKSPISLREPFATFVQSNVMFAAILIVLYKYRVKWANRARIREIEALFLSCVIGYTGFLSWMVLAHSHSLVHAHINGILFYLPFALFGFIILGQFFEFGTKSLSKFKAK